MSMLQNNRNENLADEKPQISISKVGLPTLTVPSTFDLPASSADLANTMAYSNFGSQPTSSLASPNIPSFQFSKSPVKSPVLKSPQLTKSPIMSKHNIDEVPVKSLSVKDLPEFMNNNPIIVDCRSFNNFSEFKLKLSINICIPSTLLKRASYKLPNILSAFNIPQDISDRLLNNKEVILFVDGNSSEQLNYPIYQTIMKFLNYSNDNELYYLDGGMESLDKNSDLVELQSPINSPEITKEMNYTMAPPTVLSGFHLPSSTPSNQKFLSSLKKNVPKLDLQSIKNEALTNYNYNFRIPTRDISVLDKFPQWIKEIIFATNGQINSNLKILQQLSDKFNKIEKIEQIRLNIAITNQSDFQNHAALHSAFCTPSTPCPHCDTINYKIPKGIEYGYKNRYNNIWPYEHSRVRLTESPHPLSTNPENFFEMVPNDDYFNGNYINNFEISDGKYIATQNPLPSTFKDFWRLIWNSDTRLIICLNGLSGLQMNYFNDQKLDNITIKEVEVRQIGAYNFRVINLSKHNKNDGTTSTKKIYHLEFTQWPDFGVPDIDKLLKFIDFKNQLISQHDLKKQYLVHCSAGCGRTGCYIAVDLIIDLFKQYNCQEDVLDPFGGKDLIYRSIHYQRSQRISMCQNFDQYIVCYETILKYLNDYVFN